MDGDGFRGRTMPFIVYSFTEQGTETGLEVAVDSIRATAAYIGVSEWTVRDLETAGTLLRIRIPLPHAGELRKLLFDRTDLDRLIEAWKDAR